MSSSIDKRLLRKASLDYRKLLCIEEYKKRNHKLWANITLWISKKELRSIHLFLPMLNNKEPDVMPLLPKLWQKEIMTVTSVTDFKTKSMSHYQIDSSTSLILNKLEIPEPVNALEVPLKNLEAIFIPLLVADKVGNRIGYGGGYYDRLLEETKAVKIGLSLSNPVDRIQQNDNWDIPLDFLITPFKIYNYG